MKTAFFLLSLMVCLSCGDKKPEAISGNSELENVLENKIPVHDFEALSVLLNKNNDTTYVVNFWATWCKPCIKELPAFEKLNADYATQKVKVLLVSLDFPEKLESQVIPFIEKQNIKSEVVLLDDADANSWIPKVSPEWSGAIPATLIYKKGNTNFMDAASLLPNLKPNLKQFYNFHQHENKEFYSHKHLGPSGFCCFNRL